MGGLYNSILGSIQTAETLLRIDKKLNEATLSQEVQGILSKNGLTYDTFSITVDSCYYSIKINNETLQNWLFKKLLEIHKDVDKI